MLLVADVRVLVKTPICAVEKYVNLQEYQMVVG